MVKRSDFSAVIFDMDGLVLDTERTYRIAWNEAGKALGYFFSESFLHSLTGLPSSEVSAAISDYCGCTLDLDEFNQVSGRCWRRHVVEHGIDVKPGFALLHDFLIENAIPFALASNGYAANVNECLRLAGLDKVFSIKVTREQVSQGKPAPEIFLKTADQLRMPIHRCLVLEDSEIGIEAAINAGALPVLIATNETFKPSVVARCHCQFHELGQLYNNLVEANR